MEQGGSTCSLPSCGSNNATNHEVAGNECTGDHDNNEVADRVLVLPSVGIANRVTELKNSTPEVWNAQCQMNPDWCAVLVEVNLEN